jgi:hypothetical protein
MHDFLIEADYQPLDDGLRKSLERTTRAFSPIINELLVLIRETLESDSLNVLRWALLYAVVLRDLSRSATLLLNDGGHSRAALMLRRVAFEYHTRFRFFLLHPELASTAMNTFQKESQKFAKRVGPDVVTFIYDPNLDDEELRAAAKWKRDFKEICDEVHREKAQEQYAHFYSYPSYLLHGNVMMSMDVLKTDSEPKGVHLDSARPFTNQIAGNLIVFLLDFASDVVRSFEMESRTLVEEIEAEFNKARNRLDIIYR